MTIARHRALIPALVLLASPLAAQQPAPTAQDTLRHRPVQRVSTDQNETAEPRVDNIPLDPSLLGFVRLPGTDWILRVGGYAKTDAMFDSRPAGNPDLFVTSSIPTGDPVAGEGGSFNMHVKQTRISLDLRRPSALGGMLRAYFEGDLYGPNGTTAPHLRHAYVQAANLLVGQTFSAFMDVDALPDGVDFEGPGSTTFVLSPQVRYTRPLGAYWSLALAAERPVADITAPTGATPVTRFPDVVIRSRYEAPWGHVQFSAVVRGPGYDDGQAGRNHATGFGVQPTAQIKVGPRDNVFAGGVWGHGVARYVNDLGGLGLDAAVDGNGNFTTIPAYGWYASLQHLFSSRFRGVATAGWLRVEPPSTLPGSTTQRTAYGALTAIWTPRATVDVGVSTLYGEHRTMDGSVGHAWRVQTGLQLYLVK